MAYADIHTVVAGAIEDEWVETDETMLTHRLIDLEEEAHSSGYRIDVYRIDHPHSTDVQECECAQHATDHHPYRTFNPDGNS